MINKTTPNAISRIKFGYGFIGNLRTLKIRFTQDKADAIIELIPAHLHKHLLIANTYRKDKHYAYIACMAHHTDYIWLALKRAMARAEYNRATVKYLETMHSMPMEQLVFTSNGVEDELPF